MSERIYEASATTSSGRGGQVETDDGRLSVELSVPTGLGGDGGPGTNPEQLFAAGYAACFHSALMARARAKSIRDTDVRVTVKVALVKKEPTGFRLEIQLTTAAGMSRSDLEELTAEADQMCPYSDALRGNAVVRVRVEG